jgi:hypothetical protein
MNELRNFKIKSKVTLKEDFEFNPALVIALYIVSRAKHLTLVNIGHRSECQMQPSALARAAISLA